MFNWSNENKPLNEADLMKENDKKFADKYAECRNMISQETDPLIKEKMKSRLALGITDFSDLK